MSRPTSLRFRELLELLRGLAPRQPALVHALPGAGKSALVARLAEALDMELVSLRGEDLARVHAPEVDALGGAGGFQAPRMTARPRPVVVHVTGAEAPAVAPALEELVDHRRLGAYRLPEGSALVAEARLVAPARPVLPPGLAGRLASLVLEPDLADWEPWALGAGVAPVVLAYLRERPERLLVPARPGEPGSSPRGWAAVGELLATDLAAGPGRQALLGGLLAAEDARVLGRRLEASAARAQPPRVASKG